MLQPDSQGDGHTLSVWWPSDYAHWFALCTFVCMFARWCLFISSFKNIAYNLGNPEIDENTEPVLWLPSNDANRVALLAFIFQDATKTRGYNLTLHPAAVKRKVLHAWHSWHSTSFYICIEWPFFNCTLTGESNEEPKWKAALPPSGGKTTAHRLAARLQGKDSDGRRGGDESAEWREGEAERNVGGGARRKRDAWSGGEREAPVFSLKLTLVSEEDGCINSAEK